MAQNKMFHTKQSLAKLTCKNNTDSNQYFPHCSLEAACGW